MKTFARSVHQISRLLTMTAIAGLCLLPGTTKADSLAPATAARVATAPARSPAQAAPTAGEDIRDIRPPYHIVPDWLWLAWTAGGIALVALGWDAWRRLHRAGMRVKLPYELALERLEEARRLMQPEQARAFSIAVSEVARSYIEESFSARAAHRTTGEFLNDLATSPDSPLLAHQVALTDFLRHCDLAKFARWILSVPQMEAMLQSAGVFIVATGKPVAEISTERSGGMTPAGRAESQSVSTTLNPNTI